MTVYETPVRVRVDPTPGDPTRVRLTLSAHDGECGMFEDVPVAWLRDQLAVSVPGPAGARADIERMIARGVRDYVTESARAVQAAEAERDAAVTRADTLEAQVRALAEEAEAHPVYVAEWYGRPAHLTVVDTAELHGVVDMGKADQWEDALLGKMEGLQHDADTLAAQVEAGLARAESFYLLADRLLDKKCAGYVRLVAHNIHAAITHTDRSIAMPNPEISPAWAQSFCARFDAHDDHTSHDYENSPSDVRWCPGWPLDGGGE